MPLTGSVIDTAHLTLAERERMLVLMQAYFHGVEREAFGRDLAEKPWVVVLRDDAGLLQGFSTLCLLEEEVQGARVRAFFSGDTIIDRACWGALALEKAWIRHAFTLIDREPACRWYWFLICKGYRTYRYLPVYFHRFFPSCEDAPAETAVLHHFARRKFGSDFDAARGVIRRHADYRLRPAVGDITERELRDPHICDFQQRNPGWAAGDELACLAELNRGNLKRMALRMLDAGGAG